MRERNGIVSLICLVLVSAALCGCLVVANTNRSESGVAPSTETIEQVKLGHTTAEWLIAAAGKPSSREKVDDHTELLRYERVVTVKKHATVFLLMHAQDKTETHKVVVFEVVDGIVQRHWTE